MAINDKIERMTLCFWEIRLYWEWIGMKHKGNWIKEINEYIGCLKRVNQNGYVKSCKL